MVRTPRFNYFIGHKPPEFKIWEGFEFYVPNAEVFQTKSHLKNGNLLGEYASLFLLYEKCRIHFILLGLNIDRIGQLNLSTSVGRRTLRYVKNVWCQD